jgi:hypothetical protein
VRSDLTPTQTRRSINRSISRSTGCCRGPIERLPRIAPSTAGRRALSRCVAACSLTLGSLLFLSACESTHHNPRRLDRCACSSRDPSAWLRAATRCVCRSLGWSSKWRWRGGSERAGRRRSAAVCVADAGLLELRSTSSRMMDAPQRARPTRQHDWRLREGLRSRGESASPSALLSR